MVVAYAKLLLQGEEDSALLLLRRISAGFFPLAGVRARCSDLVLCLVSYLLVYYFPFIEVEDEVCK